MKKYIILSAFALEKELVASSRIYGLTKSLKKLGNEIVLCSHNLNVENVFVYDFIDKFLLRR